MEMEHTIYHRFTETDYRLLIGQVEGMIAGASITEERKELN